MTNYVPPPVPPYATVVEGWASRPTTKYHSSLGAAKNAAGSVFRSRCLIYGFDGSGYVLIWDIGPNTPKDQLPWKLDKDKKTH